MTKRIVAASLWAFAVFVGAELAWSVFGIPRVIGPVLAALVGAFVLFDPTRRVWGTTITRRIATIPDPTAPSDAITATLPR